MMYDSKEKSESKSEANQSSSKAGIQRKNKNQEFQKELQLKKTIQRKPNNTGLPDHLKSGIENLSGHSLDDVKVHYNSSKPSQLNAHAYAQGNQIHLGGGQEKHLAHEAWHVVQQKQGRVKPTVNLNGAAINDSVSLEKEADLMGGKALQMSRNGDKIGYRGFGGINKNIKEPLQRKSQEIVQALRNNEEVFQLNTEFKFKKRQLTYDDGSGMAKSQMVAEEAEVWIDPSNPVKGTTTPSSSGIYADMSLTQGHLINAQVGGPGIAENFFPITSSLNAQHKNNIELPLKYNVVTLSKLQNSGTPWTNRHLYYKAKAVPSSWTAFDSTTQSQTQFQCTTSYTNDQHQILSSLPTTNFTATDATALVHTNLDNELTTMGAGAPGAPTTSHGTRHYTLGSPSTGGIGTIRDLFLNGTKIGTAEE